MKIQQIQQNTCQAGSKEKQGEADKKKAQGNWPGRVEHGEDMTKTGTTQES